MSNPSAKTNPMEELLGPSLLAVPGKAQKATWNLMKDADIVLLYFSASWCGPCKGFSPMLAEFYTKAAESNGVRIVFVSSDKDQPSFDAYFSTMPWYALPQTANDIQKKLATILQIQGIPSVIVLEAKSGKFITDDGRNHVLQAKGDVENYKALIDSWKETEAVPIEDAKFHEGQGGGLFLRIVGYFMKNPMYIFAVMYFYKQIMKKLEERGREVEGQ